MTCSKLAYKEKGTFLKSGVVLYVLYTRLLGCNPSQCNEVTCTRTRPFEETFVIEVIFDSNAPHDPQSTLPFRLLTPAHDWRIV